jgi:hypothetical protein
MVEQPIQELGTHSVSGWIIAPSILVPSDGVFGRFDLVALCGCHTLNVCLFVCMPWQIIHKYPCQ